MSLFGTYDLDPMTEADVEQIIVRPLLHALGFRQGTEANIRTQVPLTYAKAFLGRKNPQRDTDLRGRPDFICEVISCGRWVVEAKKPSQPLSDDDSQQAHTYAAHPEIAADLYLLTNGREFKLYRTFDPTKPLLAWMIEATHLHLPTFDVASSNPLRWPESCAGRH